LLTENTLALINVWLLGLEGLAAILAGFGIVWESKGGGEDFTKVAHATVLGSVVAETIFMLLLFASEEYTTGLQREKIISLETRLAPRSLTDDTKGKLASDLKSYAGQKFTFVVMPSPEAITFMLQIGDLLEKAGWKWVPNTQGGIAYPFGGKPNAAIDFAIFDLQIGIFPADISKLKQPAGALQMALFKNAGLEIPIVSINPAPNEPLPNMPETLLVVVGGKR
jgi:hypothetical protein